MLARMLGAALFGMDAAIVRVEAHASSGLPAVNTVGLPDSAVRESRERVRSAILNSGLLFPRRRVTVNLAPADMRKVGSALDLPMAVAIAAMEEGVLHRRVREDAILMGELALDGAVRPVAGVLSVALAARAHGIGRILIADENATEASLVEGIDVAPVATLAHAIGVLNGTIRARPVPSPECSLPAGDDATGIGPVPLGEDPADMADVRGQAGARRALEVAAAGGHNLILIGPPGAGKTMLARRLPGILPPLTLHEALEVTRIRGAAGEPAARGLVTRRPFRSPHHTATYVALVGGRGGPAGVRPGEVSLAHHGVLFLDELPEFQRHALEVLRQPLEEGEVTIARANRTASFPALFTLVASMNPCPCGYLGAAARCHCTPLLIARYRSRISGPLLDRIDLQVNVPPVPWKEMTNDAPGESTAAIRQRVVACRRRQHARSPGVLNAHIPPRHLGAVCRIDGSARELLRRAVDRLGLSARAHHRILRVARTLADLEGRETIGRRDLAEAIQYRGLDRQGGDAP